MSQLVLRESDAIVHLAFPNKDNKFVSESIQSLGLNVLKAAPMDIKVITVPDFIQTRYSIFKDLMPVFAKSSAYNIHIHTQHEGYAIQFDDFNTSEGSGAISLIPISPVPVTLTWSGEATSEDWEKLENDISVNGIIKEGVSGQRKALYFTPADWYSYKGYQGKGLNPTAQASFGVTNPSALGSFKVIVAVVSAIVSAIRYPAFQDLEHESNFFSGDSDPMSDLPATIIRTGDVEEEVLPVPKDIQLPGTVVNVKHTEVLYQIVKYDNLPPAITSIDISNNLDALPPGQGLWFPYFSATATSDPRTVPYFLQTYAKLSFGATHASSMNDLAIAIAQWGLNAETESGKELSHLVKVVGIAIEAQARPIPCVRRGKYAGTVILGCGYTLRLNDEFIRPATQDKLAKAMLESDAHVAALKEISAYLGNDTQKAEILTVTSMATLYNLLQKGWIKSKDHERIRTLAKSLVFKITKYWAPNLSNIMYAMSTIRRYETLEMLFNESPDAYPIHPSMLFNDDKLAVIWSCFGNMAPSFRVPQGTKFKLREDMSIMQKTGSGKEKKPLVRIYVRTKPLETAIDDLRWVRDEKAIENPVNPPVHRDSQMYIDKCFSKANGVTLLASLRIFADVNMMSNDKGKRKAEDEGRDEGDGKRARGGNTIVVDI